MDYNQNRKFWLLEKYERITEMWEWDGLVLIRRGSDIYVNEPHISGGVPILTKTNEGIRYHEHDFLGTTLWSTDTKGNLVKDYQDTTIFGEDSTQKDRSARFTGKPYDEDLQAYVFPYRNYDATTARWRTSDPAGYPDGINNQFYACVPTTVIDPMGLWTVQIGITFSGGIAGGGVITIGIAFGYSESSGFSAGFFETVGGGTIIGAGRSVTGEVTISNVDAVSSLAGTALSVGASLGGDTTPIIGGEITTSPNTDVQSATFQIGYGLGTPIEYHTYITETFIQEIVSNGGRIESIEK